MKRNEHYRESQALARYQLFWSSLKNVLFMIFIGHTLFSQISNHKKISYSYIHVAIDLLYDRVVTLYKNDLVLLVSVFDKELSAPARSNVDIVQQRLFI